MFVFLSGREKSGEGKISDYGRKQQAGNKATKKISYGIMFTAAIGYN